MEDVLKKSGEYGALTKLLSLWAKENPLPLVILMDEIDALVGDTLISVLRQLRSGYHKRPRMFPQSVVLCGIRDVRDYRIHSAKEKTIIQQEKVSPAEREKKIREAQVREEKLLIDTQKKEIVDLKKKQEEAKKKAKTTDEKVKVESEYKKKITQIKKKHETEKTKIKKRHKEDKEKAKKTKTKKVKKVKKKK